MPDNKKSLSGNGYRERGNNTSTCCPNTTTNKDTFEAIGIENRHSLEEYGIDPDQFAREGIVPSDGDYFKEEERARFLKKELEDLMNLGSDYKAVQEYICSENKSCCIPPLNEAELKDSVWSAWNFSAAALARKKRLQGIKDILSDPENKPFPTMNEIEEKPMEWIVENVIPKGEINVFAAEGGTGKSTLAASLIADLSRGRRTIMDDLTVPNDIKRKPLKCLYLSSEDDPGRDIKPKLEAMGADMDKIFTLDLDDERQAKMKIGSAYFEAQIIELMPDIVVIDPVQAYLDRNTNMNSQIEMRDTMRSLTALGAKYGITFFILMHTNKSDKIGRGKVSGSTESTDISRAAWMIGKDSRSEGLRYISLIKANRFGDKKSILFRFQPTEDGRTVIPVFAGLSDKTEADFRNEEAAIQSERTKSYQKKKNKEAEILECKKMILELVKDHQMNLSDINSQLESQDFSRRNIAAALKDLKESGYIEKKNIPNSEGNGRNTHVEYSFLKDFSEDKPEE